MPLVKRYTFTTGARLSSSQLNTNFDDLYNTYNTHQHTGQGNDAPQITSSGIAAGGSLITTNFNNPYKFNVYSNSAQTLTTAGTNYTIQFNMVSFDTSSNYNTGTYKYTVPVNGFYYFFANVTAGSFGSYTYYNISLIQISTTVASSSSSSSSGQTNPSNNVSQLTYCTAGDTIYVTAVAGTNNVPVTYNKYQTFFGGFLVSAV